ncbi:MAG: PilW family protein [Patescibacteria group bacterium]
MKRILKNQKGLSLIEAIVAISAFVIVVSVVLSLFLTAIGGQRKIIAQQNVQGNAMFLLGFIAKEMRMGTITGNPNYYTLNITRADDQQVSYSFYNGSLQRTVSGVPSSSGPLNSNDVRVTGRFYTIGIGIGDNQQPRVTVVIKVETTGQRPGERAIAELQTTLTQHNLEL